MKSLRKIVRYKKEVGLSILVLVLVPLGFVFLPRIWKRKKEGVPVNVENIHKSEQELSGIAETIHRTMKNFGTDEKQLFSIVKGLSSDEKKQVYNLFGERGYNYGGSVPTWLGGTKLDLFGWFREELGKDDLEEMRLVWRDTDLSF